MLKERKKKRVDQGLPENGVREGRLILSEAVERHFPTDEGFNRGVPEAQRQTVDDGVKQEDQTENDEGQNEQVRRSCYEELPCVHREGAHFRSIAHLTAPRVTPATMKRLARTTKMTAGIAVRTLPGNRKPQSIPYCPKAL